MTDKQFKELISVLKDINKTLLKIAKQFCHLSVTGDTKAAAQAMGADAAKPMSDDAFELELKAVLQQSFLNRFSK